MGSVRRLLSILLLALFGLPLVSPLFAFGQNADAGLPACCRRGGMHHCMEMGDSGGGSGERFVREPMRCPLYPRATVTPHGERYGAGGTVTAIAVVVSQANGVAQTESKWRVARERSRQKRGPPPLLLS